MPDKDLPEDRYIERALELVGLLNSVEEVKSWRRLHAVRMSILAHARTLQQHEAQGQAVEQTDHEAFEFLHIDCKMPDCEPYHSRALEILSRHRLSGKAQAQGEPVAWMYHYPGDLEHGWQQFEFKRRIQSYEGMSCNEEDAGMIETPLYAAPPTKPQHEADSGMSGEAVENAELLWANLPTGKSWASLTTHEKALVCHILSKPQQHPQADWLTGEAETFAFAFDRGEYQKTADFAADCVLRGIDKCIETLRAVYWYDKHERYKAIAALEKLREVGRG